MKTRTIVIRFKCQESLRNMPDLYIKDLEQAIEAVSNNYDKLEDIRIKLINARATVDNLQARIWADKHGYGPIRRTYEEQAS